MKKRIVSLLLVLVMLLSLLPAGVLAADGETVSVTLSGLHEMQVDSLKLYTYNEGVKGEADLLAETAAADSKYVVDLAPGAYWVDGYDANGDCNGGVSIQVSADANAFEFKRLYQISVSPSGWVRDVDYTLSMHITDAAGAERDMELGNTVSGKGQAWESTDLTCLFVLGDTISATVVPDAEKHPNYNSAAVSKIPTSNESLSLTCKEFVTLTVKAPSGSTIDAGTLKSYYVYSFLEPVETADGTATFHLDKNTDYFYRVRHPEGATYWNYIRLTASTEYTVTEENLGLSGDFSKNTRYHFENNVYDRAGIYLNINTKGYKNMAVGDTFELNSFRNWFAIESFMNAKVALPEMHYQVIDANGDPSSVVTITPNAKNSNVAVMEAKQEGTAIVLVTYDAMTHMQGMTTAKTGTQRFSAIWPELTGVFVVNVGADGSSIQTNMVLDRMDAEIKKDEELQLDAEHDILFYTGTEGASYSFKPESGCTVSVLRSTVTATAMTFSGGFTQSGVTTDEDGTVTVSGLTTGRHIIRVTKDGLSTYQVVTARGVSYQLVDAAGEPLTEDALAAIKPGDSVIIQFSNLISPKEKLSGAYNYNFSVYLAGPDGSHFKSDPGSNYGAYDFSGNPARQKLTVTIPKYWSEETYPLTGAIKQGGFSGVPTHRGITYAKGTDPKFDAPTASGILSRLPDVSIPVVTPSFLTGTLRFQDQNSTAISRANLTVTLKDSANNVVLVAEDGTFKAYAEEYFYTVSGAGVEYASGSVTLTEDGSNEFTITLQATTPSAWDGAAQTEPQTDDSGVYQIGTGAELAWFVAKSKDADVSGILTDNINLSKYVWLNITSSKKVVLDGAGHEITGLNATTGLFAQTGSNSHFHDLTIRGTVSGKSSAGAIVGYASGSGAKIENCFNYAEISSTGNNVGGLVGYTAQNAVIRNCANFGSVTGGSSVGGIIGGSVDNGSTITGCYNTAEISAASSKAGGIIGGSGYGLTVENCYNTGKISGTASGGIAGEVKGQVSWNGTVQTKITVSNCYSVGEAGRGAFGTVDTASSEISKCYYLNTLEEDENAEALSASDLKDADLSDAFGAVCGDDYPALKWQSGVTFHEASGEGTQVAARCEAKGFTRYTCKHCGKDFRTQYTPALGHDFCEDTEGCGDCVLTAPTCTQPGKIVRTCRREGCSETKEDVVPAKGHTPTEGSEQVFPGYTIYTCSVCHVEYTVWDDNRICHVSYPEQITASVSVADGSDYPWVYNTDSDRFESSNQDQNNTSSTTSFYFTLSTPAVLRFGYGVSSEQNYDKLTITLTKDGGDPQALANGISGEESASINQKLEAGRYTLTFSYSKDSSGKSGSDTAYVSELELSGMAHVIVENTTFPKTEGAAWEGTLADTWVELTGGSSMMGCIFTALDGHTIVKGDNYISSIDGLAEFHGGESSGWMGTLNGWFTNYGFENFTVENGMLRAGAEIRVMYTRTVVDLGGDWNSTDTRLKSVKFSAGKLTTAFSGDVFNYPLKVPAGTTLLRVTPTAANKNYQVHTYLGTQAEGREYSLNSLIPIEAGTVISVVCADNSWPTMNKTSDGKRTYTITVQYGDGDDVKSNDADVTSVTVAGAMAIADGTNAYAVTVPYGTTITAESFQIKLYDSGAQSSEPVKGENDVWTFTVTAEDGTAVTYTVTVTVAEAPKSSDAGVKSVTVAGVDAAAGTDENSFSVTLPAGTEVTANSFVIVTSDANASVTEGPVKGENGVWTFTVTAEDRTTTATYTVTVTVREPKTIHTTISMQAENMFIMVPTSVEVSSDLAERYGYTDDVTDGVSALDVLVKYHELIFGEDFTADTKDVFLAVSSGTITTVNGEETSAFSFAVDGEYPCDKTSYGEYGYTGYTINQCPVAEDSTVEFFFYQDTDYYMDYYTWFTDVDGNRLHTLTVQAGEDFTVGMDGYMYAYGGSLTPEDRETQGATLDPEDLQICTVGDDGTLTPVAGKTIGENGQVTLSFPTAGSYVLSAKGDEFTDIVSPWLPVTVTAAPKSNDAGVSSVTVAGIAATAGENNGYTVTLPYGTNVTADSFAIVTNHSGATVGALSNDGNVWSFTVTAEDDTTSKTYTVTVSFTEAPKSNDAGVSSVTVAGIKAKAGADNTYTVTVPYGTNVTANSFVIVTNHSGATVSALTHSRNVWSFTVTAEDGVTTAAYTVTVTIAAAPAPIKPAVDNTKPDSKPAPTLPFTDVSTSDWFYDDVVFVYENGLFSGTDSRSFSPYASMTRAMLVTVLYRLEGEPTVTGRSSFTDVRSGAYYEKAVIWAAANGIVTGTGSTTFSPDAKVTREQLAAILYRYAQYKKLDTDAKANLNSFTDAGSVSGYASEALGWAVSVGLINGASGKLMPKGDATRAQVAAILHRFVENVVK